MKPGKVSDFFCIVKCRGLHLLMLQQLIVFFNGELSLESVVQKLYINVWKASEGPKGTKTKHKNHFKYRGRNVLESICNIYIVSKHE